MEKEDVLADLEATLDKLSLFDLRQIARAVGVNRPADGKKSHIMDLILGIAQGTIEPVPQSKRGAPPKSQVFDREIVAMIKNCRAVYLQNSVADDYFQSKMQVGDVAYDGDEKQVCGMIEKFGQNWFLHTDGYSLNSGKAVSVSEFFIERYNLRCGDTVAGFARSSIEGTYGLKELISVNGSDEFFAPRKRFEDLTFDYPQKRIITATGEGDILGRMIDLFAPVALGQRAFIISPVKSGKTFTIKNLIAGFSKNYAQSELIVVLTACRPEEAEDFKRLLPKNAEFYYTTFNMDKDEHFRVANFAFERAKRRLECGKDAVIFADGLYRACSLEDTSAADKLTYCACNAKEGGSLTVFATRETDGEAGGGIASVANMCVTLSRGLAITRTFPAIDILNTYSEGEERFLSEKEIKVATDLRREVFNGMPVSKVIELFKKTNGNAELTENYKK